MIAAAFILPVSVLFGGVLLLLAYSCTPNEQKHTLNVSFGGSLSFCIM